MPKTYCSNCLTTFGRRLHKTKARRRRPQRALLAAWGPRRVERALRSRYHGGFGSTGLSLGVRGYRVCGWIRVKYTHFEALFRGCRCMKIQFGVVVMLLGLRDTIKHLYSSCRATGTHLGRPCFSVVIKFAQFLCMCAATRLGLGSCQNPGITHTSKLLTADRWWRGVYLEP